MSTIKGLQAELIKDMYRNAMLKKGYAFFDRDKRYNINIIGVRRVENATPNKFDDTIVVIYRNQQKEWEVFTADITTDPGLYWLEHPMNVTSTRESMRLFASEAAMFRFTVIQMAIVVMIWLKIKSILGSLVSTYTRLVGRPYRLTSGPLAARCLVAVKNMQLSWI